MDFEIQLFLSINVAHIGQSLTVGLHYRDVKGKVGNIFLSFDQLNELCTAFDEAKNEFNKLDAELKSKRKMKTEILVPPFMIVYQIHEEIEKQCGRSFK